MTDEQARTLEVGDRVSWKPCSGEVGVVIEHKPFTKMPKIDKCWQDGVFFTIRWPNGSKSSYFVTRHDDLKLLDLLGESRLTAQQPTDLR